MYETLFGGPFVGLVHGDPCPDNARIVGGTCRLFDFEVSGLGSVALDAAYLRAPFLSCWCFAALPIAVSERALSAHHQVLSAAGIRLSADWDDAMGAALAMWLVAKWSLWRRVLVQDEEWGTSTMRPRLLAWSQAAASGPGGRFPALRTVASQFAELCARRWPDVTVPRYPAFSGGGSTMAPPDWFNELTTN